MPSRIEKDDVSLRGRLRICAHCTEGSRPLLGVPELINGQVQMDLLGVWASGHVGGS